MYLYKTSNTKKGKEQRKINQDPPQSPSFLIKYYAKISRQNCHVWQASLQQLNTNTHVLCGPNPLSRWKHFTLVLTLLHRCLHYRAIYGERLELIVKFGFILFISVHWHHRFTKHRQMNTSIINTTLLALRHVAALKGPSWGSAGTCQQQDQQNEVPNVKLRKSEHSYKLQQSVKCKRCKIINKSFHNFMPYIKL